MTPQEIRAFEREARQRHLDEGHIASFITCVHPTCKLQKKALKELEGASRG